MNRGNDEKSKEKGEDGGETHRYSWIWKCWLEAMPWHKRP